VVAIDSDRRVKQLKGDSRPINTQEQRKYILESIRYVDQVLIFDTHAELISLYDKIKPNILVKGGDYKIEQVKIKNEIPYWMNVHIVPFVEGFSSSNIIEKCYGSVKKHF